MERADARVSPRAPPVGGAEASRAVQWSRCLLSCAAALALWIRGRDGARGRASTMPHGVSAPSTPASPVFGAAGAPARRALGHGARGATGARKGSRGEGQRQGLTPVLERGKLEVLMGERSLHVGSPEGVRPTRRPSGGPGNSVSGVVPSRQGCVACGEPLRGPCHAGRASLPPLPAGPRSGWPCRSRRAARCAVRAALKPLLHPETPS